MKTVIYLAVVFQIIGFFQACSTPHSSEGDKGWLLEEYADLNPDKAVDKRDLGFDYYYLVAEYSLQQGKVDESIIAYKNALQHRPNSYRIMVKLASLYISNARFEAAEQLLKNIDTQSLTKKEVLYLRASLDIAKKNMAEAITKLKQLIRKYPSFERAYVLLAEIFLLEKKEKEQKDLYLKLLKNVPSSYIAEKKLGNYYLAKEKYKKAEKHLLSALYKKNKDLTLYISLGFLYEKLKNYPNAINYYETALKYNRFDIRLLETMSNLYIKVQDNQRALAVLRRMAQLLPDNKTLKLKMALLYYEIEEYGIAAKHMRPLMQTKLVTDRLNYYYGVILELDKRPAESLRYLGKIPKDSEYYMGSIIHQTRVLKSQNKVETAQRLLKDNKTAFNDKMVYFELLASLYIEQGNYAEAISILKKASKEIKEKTRLHYLLGMYYDRWGKRDLCIKEMQKAIKISPQFAPALNYLGYLWVEEKKNLAKAEKLIRAALKEDPNNGYYLDSLGWLYFQKGDFKQALEYLLLANDFFPVESVILSHIGDTYYQLGFHHKSVAFYRKAMRNETSWEELKQLIHKVEKIKLSLY